MIRNVLWFAALLAVCSGSALAAAGAPKTLAGTWSGTYSGAFAGSFRLHWRQAGSKLTGSIALTNPAGTYAISGNVSGHTIKFGAVGAGATYTGSVSGRSMSGHYRTPRGGGAWSAHKAS